MKKLLITILLMSMALTLTACGKDNPEPSDNNNEISQKEKNNNGGNNSNTNEIVDDEIIDDEIIDFDDEDNPPINEEIVNVNEVINCDGCVYAYFSGEGENAKKIGDTLIPSEYTTDINSLKTSGGKQRHNFFGLVLSGDTISRAYACILKNDKIYCIEGSTNGAYHSSNIAILNQIFTASQCKTISDGHTYTCTDGYYNGDTKTSGYTSLHYETSCTIYGNDANTGKLICH